MGKVGHFIIRSGKHIEVLPLTGKNVKPSNNCFFRWGTHLCMSVFPSAHLSVMHHISGTMHHISRNFFHFFKIFQDFSDRWRCKRAKNSTKWKNKNNIRQESYLRSSIAYDHDLWYTCVKWWYLLGFVLFFQNFEFWGF